MVCTADRTDGQKVAGSPPVIDVISLPGGTGGAGAAGSADVGGAPGTVVGAVTITPVGRGDDDAVPASLSRAALTSRTDAALILWSVSTKPPFSEKSTATIVGASPRCAMHVSIRWSR